MGTIEENVSGRSIDASKKEIDTKENDATKTGTNAKPNNRSMSSLIIWNISKALERKPCMDLKSGIRTAQERLQRVSCEGNTTISQYPEEEHLVCALLAWQQLGHTDADSLYEFIASKKIGDTQNKNSENKKPLSTVIVTSNSFNIHCNDAKSLKDIDSLKFGSYSNGPVIKLPVETKIIMRMDQSSRDTKIKCLRCRMRQESQESKCSSKTQGSTDTTQRIDAACCKESACSEKLAKMDAETAELRSRAEKLAKREAQRSELLERAEAAWKDLERGYQRRLTLAQEKEEDLTRQIRKTMDDRNEFKNSCNTLAQELKERGDVAEGDRTVLKTVEAEVCHLACQRLKLNEEMTRVEAALAEQQCKTVQLQRDLQFKEEQVRRKVMTMESETESARALTHETERALRAELSGLREQINHVSNQLLEEDKVNKELKKELEQLRKEKMGMIEDLDGCKALCDGKIKKQMDELQAKRQQLQALKDKEIECRCRLPVDASVEVKRTPSLAALCKCAPEDRILDSCSCTSMKGRLLSNLLADLFGGLQSELGGTGSQMPCQLLKCLEDQHNWDRASVTKTNLRSYFSNLLVGELDIAIATSIENYHAKWVGTSCADDNIRMTPGPQDDLKEGWEKRAIERRAQKLAAQLAEELYEKRADELAKRAKTIVTSGPPPCECSKRGSTCAFPCLLEPVTPFSAKLPEVVRKASQSDKAISPPPPKYWKRTHQDVTQLRLEIEDLKKESIKREDLILMEEKITKIVQKTAVPEPQDVVTKDNADKQNKYKKETKSTKNTNEDLLNINSSNKTGITKKKSFDIHNLPKKTYLQEKPVKQPKKFNYHQTYAVNMCLCATQKPYRMAHNKESNVDVKASVKHKLSNKITAPAVNDNQTRFTDIKLPLADCDNTNSKFLTESYCDKNCQCFHKIPSNTSIDKLLETLTKWKSDLGKSRTELVNNVTTISRTCLNKNSKSILKNKNPVDSNAYNLKENKNDDSEGGTNRKKIEIEKQNHSINFHEAVKTMSEYMADVNLEKSNDYTCKYVDTTESCKSIKDLENCIIDKCSDPFNCINLTEHDPIIKKVKEKPASKDAIKILNEHLYDKTNNATIINIINNSKSTRAINTEDNRKEVALKDTVNKTNFIQNQAKIVPNNLDYYVKFLGVTLVDTMSKNTKNAVTNSHDKSSLCKEIYNNSHKDASQSDRPKSATPQSEKSKSETSKSSRDTNKYAMGNIVTDTSKKLKKCECKAKFDELKKIIIGIFNDQIKRKNTNHLDIALDSQSLSCQVDTLSSCVCCNKKQVDCTKDLEVNTFDLLEAHLKEKIKEFKISSCQSSCISAEEEEKIFHTILKRVKQVISDCANELRYNESGGLLDTSKGSWQRAYGLLQEYLKMKIKRAQCLPLINEDKDVILSDILEKVCGLIESDFEKLKDMCKCEKNNKPLTKITKIKSLSDSYKEMPQKVVPLKENDMKIINNTNKTLSKQSSIKPTVLTKKLSSQVRFNVEMENKSCDARSDLEMETKSCEALFKNIHTVNVVSTQNDTDAFKQSISSQVPIDLGMSTKSCNVTFQNNSKISKENLTEAIFISPQRHAFCQLQRDLEMETKSCDVMIKADKIVKIVSRLNIPDTMNQLQHMSTQAPPSLGMQNKYCDVMVDKHDITIIESTETLQMDTQSCDTSEFDSERINNNRMNFIPTEISKEIIYNTCNCNYDSAKDHKDLNTKTVLYNLRADFLMNCNVQTLYQQKDRELINILRKIKSLPNLQNTETTKPVFKLNSIKNETNNLNRYPKHINSSKAGNVTPHNGSTIDCICDSNFKSCTCIKSRIMDRNYKNSNNWQEFLAHSNKCPDNFSYIINDNQKETDHQILRETMCKVENILTPIHSKQMLEKIQYSANICENYTNMVTDSNGKGPMNWLICPQPAESQTRSITVKLSNSSLYYEPVDESIPSDNRTIELIPSQNIAATLYDPIIEENHSRKSETTSNTSNYITVPENNCKCNKVPLCHVKMLVENIERNLIESKCTCDTVFKICPVHCKKNR
ncbi:unnamed protein product [Arctia plantaginis]|uniref:Uncharacterized protein n=1 Tax=Arctia plantaginis TaxID=874455 RepID=A0A8S0ZTI7_ARCPL|nr:unnamed protein product [Arctia plantaginis]CAB3248510.1 unnamed protein product [Arctia plantaginis]